MSKKINNDNEHNEEATVFTDIKQKYVDEREIQRRNLCSGLEEILKNYSILTVKNRGGKGKANYTNGKNIAEFDLTNWKWVEIIENETIDFHDFSCVVTLNMIDIDTGSANFHALFDRIGLIVSGKKGSCLYKSYIYTNIDLPLDEPKNQSDKPTKIEQIAQLVVEQYNYFDDGNN